MLETRILVIDNYDSFVYNLVQYLAELGAEVIVRRNDAVTADDIADFDVAGVSISPGPGHPDSAGNCYEIIRYCYDTRLPLLGVCLGHQAIGAYFGADVVLAPKLVHGQATLITHSGLGVLAGVPSPFPAGRYHSLVVDPARLPVNVVVTASCDDLIMALALTDAPIEGVQFHPESILSGSGYRLLANWLVVCGAPDVLALAAVLDQRFADLRATVPGMNLLDVPGPRPLAPTP